MSDLCGDRLTISAAQPLRAWEGGVGVGLGSVGGKEVGV